MDKGQLFTHGLLSITTLHFIAAIDPNTLQTIANLIIQLIIGAATLWGMFKKPKPPAV